ncbi:MAG: hypothetical protein DHS20C13_22670 [Thermodesulfobacteriota bacterium]|nr:MAG: hypothetical protein DHS20C13_22670 [Thermodesulfobacteriota bacterium]
MKKIRDLQNNAISRFFLPALAVLFVFSLSFHNHGIGDSIDLAVDSHSSASHSAEDCSACLLQGNLQVPKTEISFNASNFGQLIAYIGIDFTVPHSFVDLNKPSRAPPTV